MPRKKKIEVEQLSLFENPQGPTVAQFKDQLVAEFRAQKGAYLQEAKKKRKRNRADSIFLPEDQRAYQDSFAVQPVYEYPQWCFPPVSTKPESVKHILMEAIFDSAYKEVNGPVRIGLDFEFSPEKHKISIIGVANQAEAAACRWDDSFLPLLYAAVDAGVVFVGHWVLGADKFELENAAREAGLPELLARPNGYLTPHGAWLDSMGLHYLCNQALCKAPGKEQDEEGSLGYMGIGSALFLSSSIPAGYKHCRGTGCTGPCPKCRVFDYCAVDAYSGLLIAENYLALMQEKNIPFSCYEKWAELTLDVCLRAESRGLLVNKPFLDGFDKELEKTKAELFPYENSAYKYFNPQSGKQIIDYFADRGVPLRDSHGKASSTKNVILGALERELTKYGFRDVAEFEGSDDQVVLSEVDELLYKLFLYKDTGKDSTAWFNQEKKFLVQHDGAWWIHPRFSTTGASTTRLSSSRPNFQNFKKRGLGAAIRKAIIPRPGCIMCANDAKQLEFRIVSYEAGIEVPSYDFFDWLVGRANGQFEKAAETMHAKARDIAKRVNHASAYGEGFRLFDHWQLSTKRTHQQVVDGSLRIFEDWIMDGKIVGFTGANLAQTLFGDKTDISRRKALNLQFDVWLRAVPEIHPWHRKMAKIAERGWAQLRTGHYLELLGSPSDNFKAGCAYYGQGGGAQFMQDKMIECARRYPDFPMCAQIHDDLMWDSLPASWSVDEIKSFVAHLSNEEAPSFPGLLVPFETQTGPNWGEMRSIG